MYKKMMIKNLIKTLLFGTTIAAIMVCCGDKKDGKEEKPPEDLILTREIAKVRGKIFNLDDFKKYLRFETYGNETLKLDDETLSFYLERFVEHKALLNEAIERKTIISEGEINQKVEEMKQTLGVDQSTENHTIILFDDKGWIEYFKESQIVNRYVEVSLTSGVVISQNEEKEYYNKLYGSQKPQRRYDLSQIFVSDKKTAQTIKNQLDKNKKDFDMLAKKHSSTPEGARGGAIGWYTVEQLPEYLERAVIKLRPEEISDIIESENGYIIIRLNDSEIQYAPSYNEAREFVRYKLLQEKRENYLAEHIKNIWLEKKTDKSGIMIYFENLDFTYTPVKR
jgi:parvulin-like peptidyl-prolyl isomerase